MPSAANRLSQADFPSTPMNGKGTPKIFAWTLVVKEAKSVSGVNFISIAAVVFRRSLQVPVLHLEIDTSSDVNFFGPPTKIKALDGVF